MPDYSLKTWNGLCLWYGYLHLIESTAEPVSHAIFLQHCHVSGHAVAQLVEALLYEPEVRGFDSRWSQWNFSLK